jgi:hypothetical protein
MSCTRLHRGKTRSLHLGLPAAGGTVWTCGRIFRFGAAPGYSRGGGTWATGQVGGPSSTWALFRLS